MTLDPNTPVIVGVAQLLQREDDPLRAREPLTLMREAIERAAQDAGARELCRRIESLRVVRGVWPYEDPGRVLASELDVPGAETCSTPYGGNMVQSVLNQSALEILRGERRVVALVGAETGRTQARARRAGIQLSYRKAPGKPDRIIGEDHPMLGPAELARKIRMPIQIYPMFENALRHARGDSLEAQRVRIGELWARFNSVAVDNPHAWIREAHSADEIATPSPSNRMIGFPYTLMLNSNSRVDMAAAIFLCSLGVARSLQIPDDRLVYPHAGTDAHDTDFVSNRVDLHSSPAIRFAGRRVLELARLGVDDLGPVDVYSCFPSAVQVAAQELGLSLERPLTVTGGLTFGGGPLNNYVMHSIARMVERLRAEPGTRGLITANGGFLTKHAFGVYSSEPPVEPFRHEDLQAQVDALPSREAVVDFDGPVEIESYTVMHGAEGPERAHAACLLSDGRRSWASSSDPELMAAMTREEFCGKRARIDGHGELAV
ncbi:MAG: acetyl-CoA acetyltransferase [Myxococcota bacterium]